MIPRKTAFSSTNLSALNRRFSYAEGAPTRDAPKPTGLRPKTLRSRQGADRNRRRADGAPTGEGTSAAGGEAAGAAARNSPAGEGALRPRKTRCRHRARTTQRGRQDFATPAEAPRSLPQTARVRSSRRICQKARLCAAKRRRAKALPQKPAQNAWSVEEIRTTSTESRP